MSVPLGKGNSGSGSGRRPTEHQLQMARVRARTTGESVAHVLSVFMGEGRHGPQARTGATGPEAPLTGDSGPHGEPEGAERLAPVIPLSRARGKDESGACPQEE